MRRSLDQMPKRGSKEPWRLRQNYAVDIVNLRHGKLEDGTLRFTRRGEADAAGTAAEHTVAA